MMARLLVYKKFYKTSTRASMVMMNRRSLNQILVKLLTLEKAC